MKISEYKKLEKKYEHLIRSIKKAKESLELFEESIKDICHHPEKYKYTYTIDCDDGYGTWWKRETCFCKMCGKKLY